MWAHEKSKYVRNEATQTRIMAMLQLTSSMDTVGEWNCKGLRCPKVIHAERPHERKDMARCTKSEAPAEKASMGRQQYVA